MPTTLKVREYLHKQIDLLDGRLLHAVYAMLKSYQESELEELILTKDQVEDLDRRIKMHKEGKSRSYTWQDVKKRTLSGQ